jgi:hypothetical protein
MRDPASLSAGRRAGPRIDNQNHDIRSYATPDSAPQRPISRRKPNPPFRDDVCAASGLGGLTIDVVGGASRPLQAVLESEGDR